MYSRQTSRRRGRGKNDGAVDPLRKPWIFRWVPVVLIALVLAMVVSFVGASHPASAATSQTVDVVALNSKIDASSRSFVTNAISTAESDGVQALVIKINTPGGDISAMQAITTAELNSTVPIITYVTPAGAYGASAGAFVTLAAPLAAMAPSTTLGASSPVNSDGSNLNSTEQSKVESVLTTMMTNMQQRYGRNVPLAVKMVTDAASYSDQVALKDGITNFVAANLGDLLTQADGKSVTLANGRNVTLQTADANVRQISESLVDNLYLLLIDPNVLFLLFIIAIIGIYVEISHPGLILPGVAGSISLLLFLFGAGSLSPNWAGLALMGLALVLLILDIRLTTHGVLTIGAVISLVVGSLLFFNSGGPYNGAQVNPVVVYVMSGLIGCLGLYVVMVVIRTRRTPVNNGTEGMIGAKVTAITPLAPEGRVSFGGENWSAVLEPPTMSVDVGSELRIIAVEGLRLHVQLFSILKRIEKTVDQICPP